MHSWCTHTYYVPMVTSIVLRLSSHRRRFAYAALRSFVNEMKSQGRWDDVTVLSASEFGRTITSNGLGTDHGWGGNHFVLGGSVNGGKIHGRQ